VGGLNLYTVINLKLKDDGDDGDDENDDGDDGDDENDDDVKKIYSYI